MRICMAYAVLMSDMRIFVNILYQSRRSILNTLQDCYNSQDD